MLSTVSTFLTVLTISTSSSPLCSFIWSFPLGRFRSGRKKEKTRNMFFKKLCDTFFHCLKRLSCVAFAMFRCLFIKLLRAYLICPFLRVLFHAAMVTSLTFFSCFYVILIVLLVILQLVGCSVCIRY